MAVPLTESSGSVKPGPATQLVQLTQRPPRNDEREYDVTSDGQRFLVNSLPPERRSLPITVVVNWQRVLDAK